MNGQQVAEALAGVIGTVEGLRSYAYMPDTFVAPGAVVGQPDMLLEGGTRTTFCTVEWSYPITLAVARGSERQAQLDLFGFLDGIVEAINADPQLGGAAMTATVTDARPVTASVNGQDLPAYTVNIRVLA